jgi:hypothetical protein
MNNRKRSASCHETCLNNDHDPKKIAIAEVKRCLAKGIEYPAEFIGINAKMCKPGMQVTRRVVLKNKTEMASIFLDGPEKDESIYLNWKNVTADERDGSIFLSMTETEHPEEFLKITLTPAALV